MSDSPPPVIAVIGMGEMGAALAGRLARSGAHVLSTLTGRSAVSARRARQAGVRAVSDAEVLRAQMILSVVPPVYALEVATHWAQRMADTGPHTVYVDCNAVSVTTVHRIATTMAHAGARFVDGCIIGKPGEPTSPGPAIYLAGEYPDDQALLARLGLRVRSTGGPIGAASALKMAYAGFNKGLTGLAAAMVLAATRAGASQALRQELAESQPGLLAHIQGTLPDMYAKAWRWDYEMRQVGEFASPDEDVTRVFEALGEFFGRLGQDWSGPCESAPLIDAFLQLPRRRP